MKLRKVPLATFGYAAPAIARYEPPVWQPTHPSQLAVRPEELNFEVSPYEPRPFAQHFIIPVQGELSKQSFW